MKYKHTILLSYDQNDSQEYEGNFRVDILKCLLCVPAIDVNSFNWWVNNTMTFDIVTRSKTLSTISPVDEYLKVFKLKSHMSYIIAELNRFSHDKPAITCNPPKNEDIVKFFNDLRTAMNQSDVG